MFGSLAVYITTAKLKSAKISYSHDIIYIWQSRTELPNLNRYILAITIWGSTTKFNSHQYFQLYGRYATLFSIIREMRMCG